MSLFHKLGKRTFTSKLQFVGQIIVVHYTMYARVNEISLSLVVPNSFVVILHRSRVAIVCIP